MRLLSQSGTNNFRLSNPGVQNGELLNVDAVVKSFTSNLNSNGYMIGIIFSISDIRLQVKLLNTLSEGVIPDINFEDSTATRLSNSIVAKNSSARIGLEFLLNNKTLGLIELKNYNITYSLPVLGKFAKTGKFLNPDDILNVKIVNLGSGGLALNDYIDIAIDYIFEIDGFKVNDDLTLKFE